MSLLVKEEKREFKPDPEGLYDAKCISIIDLGEQETEYEGKSTGYKPKVLLEFEIPEIVIEYEKDNEKKSFNKVIRKEYTANLGEKSNLRKDLNSWRSKAFTENDLKGFDLKNILGKDCQIQIIHETKQGKTRQINNILPVSKGHKSITVTNELTIFDFDSPNALEEIEQLPEWLQKKLKESKTYAYKKYGNPDQSEPDSFNPDDYEGQDLIGEDEIPF